MKKYITIFAISGLMALCSCESFLEESSQNEFRPTTISELEQTLLGEGFPLTTAFHTYMDVITGDVQANFLDDEAQIAALNRWSSAFLWKKTMAEDLSVNVFSGINSYSLYYGKIKGCNVVLDNLDLVSGDQDKKDKVKGEALFLRSFYYYNLVNLYGKPYGATTTDPDSDLGVPLLLSAGIMQQAIERATITEVYNQIENDLLDAYNLLEITSESSVYHPNQATIALLLSRIYLYKKEWNKSIDFANKTLQLKNTLKNLNDEPVNPPNGFSSPSPYYQMTDAFTSPEVIWSYGNFADYTNAALGAGVPGPVLFQKVPYTVSNELSDLYVDGDRRNILYFSWGAAVDFSTFSVEWYKYFGAKYNPTHLATVKAFRVAEAYLNRAEATIQKAMEGNGSVNQALEDLNTLRAYRITTSEFQDITITDPAMLYEFYKQERRRELCFEDQRWYDVRRWGESITHILQLDANGSEIVTIQPGDPEFTLQIPEAALVANPNLVQN